MDLTRDIIYRGYKLNDENIVANIVQGQGVGQGITGCVLDTADSTDADVVQFLEKRSLQDGMDAGDVFLGARRIRLAGTLYGLNRNLLYDGLRSLRAALSPTLAQSDQPADKGFQPLYFSEPTNNQDATVVTGSGGKTLGWPAGAIDLRLLAVPRQFSSIVQRDQVGGEDNDALAIPWQATLLCRDPRIMSELPQDHTLTNSTVVTGATAAAATNLVTKTSHGLVAGDRVYFTTLTGGVGLSLGGNGYYVISSGLTSNDFKVSTTSGGAEVDITTNYTNVEYVKVLAQTGNTVNRGSYYASLNALFVVGATSGSLAVTIGDSNFTITLPASTGNRTIRFKGDDKVLTVEEGGVEILQMSYLTFNNQTTWPRIPTGVAAFSVTPVGLTITTGTHFWYWEAFA